jgi:hypothetical protein
MDQNVLEARRWLSRLRQGATNWEIILDHFRREVERGSFSLSEIGTNEDELENLRVRGCKTAAVTWLSALRNGSNQFDLFLSYLREEIQKGGLSLVEIGTSHNELEGFRSQLLA